jgi:transposase-like protein
MDGQIKPTTQTFGELCQLYGVSETTLRKWLKKIKEYKKGARYYTPLEVKRIYEKLGEP